MKPLEELFAKWKPREVGIAVGARVSRTTCETPPAQQKLIAQPSKKGSQPFDFSRSPFGSNRQLSRSVAILLTYSSLNSNFNMFKGDMNSFPPEQDASRIEP